MGSIPGFLLLVNLFISMFLIRLLSIVSKSLTPPLIPIKLPKRPLTTQILYILLHISNRLLKANRVFFGPFDNFLNPFSPNRVFFDLLSDFLNPFALLFEFCLIVFLHSLQCKSDFLRKILRLLHCFCYRLL